MSSFQMTLPLSSGSLAKSHDEIFLASIIRNKNGGSMDCVNDTTQLSLICSSVFQAV